MRIALLLAGAAALWGLAAPAHGQTSVFFLHNSTGRNIMNDGEVRVQIEALRPAGTEISLWDHDYNDIGLRGPDGVLEGYGYGIPNDDTDPAGQYLLWCTDNAARDSILSRYDIVLFKSCFTASEIKTDEQLQQYKDWYLAIRDVLDQHPEPRFIVMSPPPLHRLFTDPDEADRVRNFANFLGSPEYLDGHDNILFFDLFDLLATPDDGAETRNTLRYEYERDHQVWDSHPNDYANSVIGPILAQAIVDAAATGVPADTGSWGGTKALFR